MKLAVCVFATLALTANASGFECPFGVEGRLEPVKWSAEQSATGTFVRLGIRNTFDKPVKMVDGGVWFVDPLGRIVSGQGLELDPDFQIPSLSGNIAGMDARGFDRLVGAEPNDFTPHVCVQAILFEDGSKAEF